MNYLVSTKRLPILTNISMLIGRIFIGIAMIVLHVLPKLELLFAGKPAEFYNFFTLGARNTLILVIVLEVTCSFLLVVGLFTRGASVLLALIMLSAALFVHGPDSFEVKEVSLLYLCIYMIIIALGPGSYSVDRLIDINRKWCFKIRY